MCSEDAKGVKFPGLGPPAAPGAHRAFPTFRIHVPGQARRRCRHFVSGSRPLWAAAEGPRIPAPYCPPNSPSYRSACSASFAWYTRSSRSSIAAAAPAGSARRMEADSVSDSLSLSLRVRAAKMAAPQSGTSACARGQLLSSMATAPWQLARGAGPGAQSWKRLEPASRPSSVDSEGVGGLRRELRRLGGRAARRQSGGGGSCLDQF